jgi:hypothetical protein
VSIVIEPVRFLGATYYRFRCTKCRGAGPRQRLNASAVEAGRRHRCPTGKAPSGPRKPSAAMLAQEL